MYYFYLYIRAPIDSSDFLSLTGILCLNKGVLLTTTQRIGPLHIIQSEISSKQSKKTKIYQKSYSILIFQIRLKNNTINFQVICPSNN
jgi:hypothetical protein